MKTTRIFSAAALSAGLLLGLTGCGLVAPQATTEDYAPSDGVQFTLDGVAVRNLLLIETAEEETFNVVMSTANTSGEEKMLQIHFTTDSGQVATEFSVPTGLTGFGNPAAEPNTEENTGHAEHADHADHSEHADEATHEHAGHENGHGHTPRVAVVKLPGYTPGSTVKFFAKVNDSDEHEGDAPILDGTLSEYKPYVLSKQFLESLPNASNLK